MTPNFSLHLSADGLRLSYLAAAGWQNVGAADVSAPDLAAQLADLQRKANDLSRGDFRTKLVLPEDQIRYLSFAAENFSRAACRSAAAEALDGATPYEIEELLFDTFLQDGLCHVAAVARETLEEAEAFAAAHGFGPVCFVAEGSAHALDWEPFFGPTANVAAARQGETADAGPNVAASDRAAMTVPHRQGTAGAEADTPLFTSRREPASATPEPLAAARGVIAQATPRYSVAGLAEPAAAFTRKSGSNVSEKPSAETAIAAPPPQRRMSPVSEAERLTVFGARHADENTPRRGGNRRLIAASLLLLGLAAGAWSAGLLPSPLSGLMDGKTASSGTAPKAQFTSPIEPLASDKQLFELKQQPLVELEKVLPVRATLTDEDSAVLDALASPLRPDPDQPLKSEPAQAERKISGVWVQSPSLADTPQAIDLAGLYVSRTAPVETARGVARLPDVPPQSFDLALAAPETPGVTRAPSGQEAPFIVTPAPSTTGNPNGSAAFPDARPSEPAAAASGPSAAAEDPRFAGLAGLRPRIRPQADTAEPETVVSQPPRPELAAFRPRMRATTEGDTGLTSASLVPLDGTPASAGGAAAASTAFASATERAIAQSPRPDARPSNFGQIVTSSRSIASTATAPSAAPAPVRTASVAPQRVAPSIPSSTSARRESTIKNAINLRKINLIGVYGKPSDRRALVRLANGRYEKVQVGDRIDGGRISAIGDDELRYQKSGRNMVLKMPQG